MFGTEAQVFILLKNLRAKYYNRGVLASEDEKMFLVEVVFKGVD